MHWFFDGIGTLLVGLIVGGGVGGGVGWRLGVSSVRQRQRAGDHATQMQIGGSQTRGD